MTLWTRKALSASLQWPGATFNFPTSQEVFKRSSFWKRLIFYSELHSQYVFSPSWWCYFCLLSWDRVSLRRPCCHWTCDLPVSTFWVLGLQRYTATPGFLMMFCKAQTSLILKKSNLYTFFLLSSILLMLHLRVQDSLLCFLLTLPNF